MKASATSTTTTAFCSSRLPPRPALRPPVRRTSSTSGLEARIDKMRPNATAAVKATAAVNASTFGSMLTVSARGRLAGAMASSVSMPMSASRSPASAPPPAMTKLSASSWRTSRQRLPPSAARTASWRSRWDARTRSRFATLAQAISSTNATAPMSASRAGRTSATRSAFIGSTRKCRPDVSLIGNAFRSLAASTSTCACARPTVTPSSSRPMTRMKC